MKDDSTLEVVTTTGTTCNFTVPEGTRKITITFESIDIPEIEMGDCGGTAAAGYLPDQKF